jgi:cytochrome c oxidase subunit 2
MVTYFWFTPTKTGTYEILCAELCGVGHHIMRGTVIVDNAEDYQAWLQEQQTFSQMLAEAAGQKADGVEVASVKSEPAR